MNDRAKTRAEILDAIRDTVVRTVRPKRIILFGSHARGDARPESDWDLLIIVDTDRPTWEVRVDARVAMMDLCVPMDLIVLTPEDLNRHAAWSSSVVAEAMRSGRVIYEAAD